ncbi:MAG: flippase-like domain-containing protein [Lentimicrobium sp.]|nr:flippase-like domain-containing protein [Lentimicrobium sp.]
MKKSLITNLLKIVGSALILWLLISRIDWDRETFRKVIEGIKPAWFLLSLTGVILVLGMKSIRWNLLLKQEGCSYPLLSSFHAYLASFTIGLITPGRLGEIARLYYVREDTGVNFYTSFKTIVADRIFDFAILFWFGATGMLYFYKVLGEFHGIVYLILAGIAMLVMWFIVNIILKKFIKNPKPLSLLSLVKDTWGGLFGSAMILPWSLTLLAYLLFYIANQWIFRSIGVELQVTDIGFILSLMSLATLIPISIAGFGTREASLVFLLGFYSLSPEVAIVFSLLQFTAFFLWGGIAGLICWLIKPVSISLIKKDYQTFMEMLKKKRTAD